MGGWLARRCSWGFKPAWSKAPVTNAQFETLSQKPTFKDAFVSRRCLVPADGFYEWTTFCAKRQPIRHTLVGEPLFFFAGLWSVKEPPGHFVIITVAANQVVREVHERMPLIVAPDDYDSWLGSGESYKAILPTTQELRTCWVNQRINNVRNEDEESGRPLTGTVKNALGGYVLPAGLPEGATVKIVRFSTGYFDVEFDQKRFEVPIACMDHEGRW